SATDRSYATAEHSFQQGELLRAEGTAESLKQAIPKYKDAISLFASIGDRRMHATVLDSLGRIYNNTGAKQQGLDCFTQALELYRALGDRRAEAEVLGRVGSAYMSFDFDQAAKYFNQALPMFRAQGNRKSEAEMLNNLGVILYQTGEFQKALYYY